ncbi:MAG TPA: peptide chain release factor N(5)-glutamine methyltransferase [Acidobacteriaceae bacterium]|jgi:release factor glutamine methyltransferase|nr:peptide chain release factor N(5)-glutamine methyltransferase [Acidobacteriaceae bacterium]
MTVTEAREFGMVQLSGRLESLDRSRADATMLLMHVLQCTRAEILERPSQILLPKEEQHYRRLLAERARNKPIQYITGQQEFWGLPFFVTPDVLIPRPETEHLVEAAIEKLQAHPAPRIVDVGTGSGAIAVALADTLPQAQITAIDISEAALAVAQKNAVQNGVANRIRWMQCDLLTDVTQEEFDAVISNPPYIADVEYTTLAVEVRDYEPATAVFAGPTGLEIYERLIPQAACVLVPGGWLLLEMGYKQKAAIEQLLQDWQHIAFMNDLQGIARVACAQPPRKPSL